MSLKKLSFATVFISIAIISIAGYLYFAKQQPALAQITSKIYYIDYEGGNDSNDGLSIANPWKHVPGDAAAINNANKILTAGDILIFKGGVIYSGIDSGTLITINNSGSLGNEIVYRGNTEAGDWGAGKAIINLNAKYYHAFNGSSKNYIKIKNFEIYNAKSNYSSLSLSGSCPAGQGKVTRGGIDQCVAYGGGSNNQNLGIIYNGGGNHWLIKDSIIRQTENWSDVCVQNAETDGDNSTTADVPADQTGISLYGSGTDSIEIDNIEFYGIGRTIIDLFRASNVIVRNSNFGGINRGSDEGYFSVAFRMQYSTNNIIISNNTFHDGWQYEGDDIGQRCHAGDWIHIYGNTNPAEFPNNIMIKNNLFYNNKAFANAHGTAVSFIENGANNITFRNNSIINSHNSGLNTQGSVANPVDYIYFYNNTFVNYDMSTGGAENLYLGINTGNHIEIMNNILINNESISTIVPLNIVSASLTPVSNNNVFYNSKASTSVRRGSANYTLVDWQITTSQDGNSSAENPNLVNVTSLGSNSGNGNYEPSFSSVNLINKGVALSGFNDDKDGTPRPQGSAWDIGAYEYIQAPLPLKGDFNSDKKVNDLDFTDFKNAFKSIFNSIFDLNSDSIIDVKDLGVLMSGWLE